jgi:hypothetical protein
MTKTLIVTSIIITTLFLLTSCALFGTANPHTEGLILPPKTLEGTTLPVGDIESSADITLIITPSTWFENVKEG